jgi:hypothetical protein
MALRAKIRPDEAEPEGYGGSTVEGENEVWPDFRRNPKGRGQALLNAWHVITVTERGE